jgi:hypothetical protein
MKRFVEGQDRSQLILLPDCLDDYVGEDNPDRIVRRDQPVPWRLLPAPACAAVCVSAAERR